MENNRRKLLKTMGIAGGALAVSAVAGPLQVSAASGRHNVMNVATVADLDKLESLVDGDIVFVAGYDKAGDGGAKTLRWVANSTKTVNNGTVHGYKNATAGRFEVVHEGVADYRWFGILDENTLADDAFDAMASDPDIYKIEAHTDLSFQKRHKITRSNLTLDFNGHEVYSTNMAPVASAKLMELCPVFLFTGETVGNAATVTLTKDMPEYTDVYEVPDGFDGKVGDWYLVVSDVNPYMKNEGRTSAIEIQRMAMVTKVLSDGTCCFNHRPAFTIAKGRTISFQKVNPIENITVRNISFHGNGSDPMRGTHPFTFLYGVHCDAFHVNCEGTFAACIFRQYCTNYVTEECFLTNPSSLAGGRGYLTQQLYCNYGSVRNCQLSFGRHLNDFTGSSYMLVENCHVNYDYNGGFVTHGQYEHDLTYIGNSGLMSFANSQAPWASTAKNISVKRHSGCNLNAGNDGTTGNRIINLTIEDCHIVEDTPSELGGKSRVNGVINLNCDGVSVKNCYAGNMLYLLSRSAFSSRPNVLEDSYFNLSYTEVGTKQAPYLTGPSLAMRLVKPVTFRNCTFANASGKHFYVGAPLVFDHCTFTGAEGVGENIHFALYEATFIGCKFEGIGLALEPDSDTQYSIPAESYFNGKEVSRITMKDCSFTGDQSVGAITISSSAAIPTLLDLNGVTFSPDSKSHVFVEAGAADKLGGLKMRGCSLVGGKSNLASGAASYCIITDNYLSNHTFAGVPSSKVAAQNVNSGSTGL